MVTYEKLPATTAMRGVPRFGHSREFSQLFGSKDDAMNYFVGLMFAGSFCLGIFILWTLTIFVLKCRGSRRVGFLAGGPFVKPADSSKEYKRPFTVRVVFVNCGLIFIAFSILFVTQGLTNLNTTVKTMTNSARKLQDTSSTADNVLKSIASIGQNAQGVRQNLTAYASDPGFCLNNPSLLNRSTTNFAQILNATVSTLQALGDFMGSSSNDLSEAATQTSDICEVVIEQTNQINLTDWPSLIVLIPFTLVPTALLVGVVIAWFEVDSPMYKSFLSWCVLPLFIILTIAAYTLSCVIMITASANADFCSGGEEATPGGTLLGIMEQNGYYADNIEYRIATFYINQCSTENPLSFLSDYEDDFIVAKGKIDSLFVAVNSSTVGNSTLSMLCGDSLTGFVGTLSVLKTNVVTLAQSAAVALELLRCENIVALYTNTFFGGTCTYSVNGVTWAFSSFMVVGTAGLIMIMLRSSWQNVLTDANSSDSDFVDEIDDNDDEYFDGPTPYISPKTYPGYDENYERETSLASAAASAPVERSDDREEDTIGSASLFTSAQNDVSTDPSQGSLAGSTIYTTSYDTSNNRDDSTIASGSVYTSAPYDLCNYR